jgi:hypothetical protein
VSLTKDKDIEVRQFRGHEDHTVVSFSLDELLYKIICSCGVKFEYTRQPIEVASHIKRQYRDKKTGLWVIIQHDHQCRFQQFCTCDN